MSTNQVLLSVLTPIAPSQISINALAIAHPCHFEK
jgi:hypothetical protein